MRLSVINGGLNLHTDKTGILLAYVPAGRWAGRTDATNSVGRCRIWWVAGFTLVFVQSV